MKFLPLSLTLLAATLVTSLSAQSEPAAKPIEAARMAFINSTAFSDPAIGIKQAIRSSKTLQLEFESVQSELALMGEKLRTLAGEMSKLNADASANAEALDAKRAEGTRLQEELMAKQTEAQAAFNKRQQEVQGPVAKEIAKELNAFTKERNISVLLDAAKLNEALLNFDVELDVTTDFIAYFNARHE